MASVKKKGIIDRKTSAARQAEAEAEKLSQSEVAQPSSEREHTMAMPSVDDDDKDPDQSDPRDHLLNNHTSRLDNKRRFQTDLLARTLGCSAYFLDVFKDWGKNEIADNIPVQFTREFPEKNILFDKFDLPPQEELIKAKMAMCHAHRYLYIYETPEELLTHDVLNRQLNEQRALADRWREKDRESAKAEETERREEFKRRFGKYPEEMNRGGK